MQEKDKTRRKVLIGLTSAVGLSGIPFAATPFIAAWNPSAKAKAAGAPVKLDVSKCNLGSKFKSHGESNQCLLLDILKKA